MFARFDIPQRTAHRKTYDFSDISHPAGLGVSSISAADIFLAVTRSQANRSVCNFVIGVSHA
jgi:hypothetical protein